MTSGTGIASAVAVAGRVAVCAGVWDLVGGVPDDYDECNWSAGDATTDGSTVYLATSAGHFKLMDTRASNTTAGPNIIIANRWEDSCGVSGGGGGVTTGNSSAPARLGTYVCVC